MDNMINPWKQRLTFSALSNSAWDVHDVWETGFEDTCKRNEKIPLIIAVRHLKWRGYLNVKASLNRTRPPF